MLLSLSGLNAQRLPAPLPVWHASTDALGWAQVARAAAESGARLVSMWGVDRHACEAGAAGHVACAAFALPEGLLWLELPLQANAATFPDLAQLFPAAGRMQRAMADLSGLRAHGHPDHRPWLDHGVWTGRPPLQQGEPPAPTGTLPADYAFVRVQGEGVHEIAVGPVHAGIIEPGHFRFSVVGEKVLKLEQHLGYVHKGIERRFTELPPRQAHRLAGRISGDSTVAYAWAYAMALESAWRTAVPERALWLRALMLERERVANHLGDLGALGNDAALGFGLAQFSRLREDWQRRSGEAFKGIDFQMLDDGDPRANEWLKKMRQAWDDAPVNPALVGQVVRIPGFVVPLEDSKEGLKEFLLVPYFGACIHSPPPPANQIIHVLPNPPVKGVRSMDTVWISGKLTTGKTDTYMGASSYRIEATQVAPYKEPAR